MAAEDANLRNWRFGTFGDLAARVRNYASRGRESANYGGAILLGLTALEWEEGAQHPAHWRFVTSRTVATTVQARCRQLLVYNYWYSQVLGSY